jgi:hypothetical protein
MPGASGSVQPRGQVIAPGLRGSGGTADQRHQIYDRDGDRDRHRDQDRDRHAGWDRRGPDRPYWGHYGSYHYPRYGYYYPGPYGTYPGRWVWDGWNWIFVPIH